VKIGEISLMFQAEPNRVFSLSWCVTFRFRNSTPRLKPRLGGISPISMGQWRHCEVRTGEMAGSLGKFHSLSLSLTIAFLHNYTHFFRETIKEKERAS
jgi:hypothetical protein